MYLQARTRQLGSGQAVAKSLDDFRSSAISLPSLPVKLTRRLVSSKTQIDSPSTIPDEQQRLTLQSLFPRGLRMPRPRKRKIVFKVETK
jgi:aspartyl/asparaginyl beta-hydroxylase (cupin superfamily)